jgi:hypothetical protein
MGLNDPFPSQKKLVEKHGQIQDIAFFKTQMAEENIIEDFGMSLSEVGLTGAPLDQPEQVRMNSLQVSPCELMDDILHHNRDLCMFM